MLPSELGNLTMMESFFVSSNKLHGPVPSELGNMRHAHQFSLHNNSFDGPIPSELGQVRLCVYERRQRSAHHVCRKLPSAFLCVKGGRFGRTRAK